jgi:hypothetical protein
MWHNKYYNVLDLCHMNDHHTPGAPCNNAVHYIDYVKLTRELLEHHAVMQ